MIGRLGDHFGPGDDLFSDGVSRDAFCLQPLPYVDRLLDAEAVLRVA